VIFDLRRVGETREKASNGGDAHSKETGVRQMRAAVTTDWTQVHLVRLNPQGFRMDTERQVQDTRVADDIKPVLAELKKMREKKCVVIGMKIFGDGQMKTDGEREASLKFAMGDGGD
jgi:hypothetical protein